MIICPNPDCRAENEDGVLYCDKCGADLQQEQDSQAISVQPQLDDEEENIVDATDMEAAEYAPIVTPPSHETGVLETPAQKAAVQPAIQTKEAKLTVLRGGKVGEEFPIIFEGLHVIGRTDPDGRPVDIDLTDQEVSLTQPSVSRQHAAITVENGKYIIEDLGSTNKVSINREPFLQVGQPRELNDGDIIILGRIHLKFTLS
ncbi:FHA domain-containing protein [Candidatus Poribacteria bacterium]|nr:FHA domain-containing protein [Candidatus Poribacteria bacterium]